jgi:AraC family transcriptional regulator of adaptative response / DNA-3-methyladenine glycosylase II
LLTDTGVPVTQIAFASGFSSLRRFNDAFSRRYGMPPTRLRSKATEGAPPSTGTTSVLTLAYRPPYDWEGVLAFLAGRALAGVEWVTPESYARTVRLGDARGWLRVTRAAGRHALRLEFPHTLMPALPELLRRVRALFDLDARPDLISTHLASSDLLAAAVKRNPGLRVPGAFNGFELGVRAILGQQVSVKAATTIASRFVRAFGEPVETPFAQLDRLTPSATRVASSDIDTIAGLGIVAARARSLIALADAQGPGALCLDGGAQRDPDDTIAQLTRLPGIGPWTAQYIAMRALRWPDAFPKEDIAVRNNLGGVTIREAESLSQAWRPWRSYAVMHIWRMPAAPHVARGR